MDHTPIGKVCSFCGVVGTSKSSFAGGLGALMCSHCVMKYYEIMSSPETKRELQRPWWNVMTDEEILATVPKITAVQEQLDDFLREWIKVVRSRGLTWADVGRVMGITRQAAWQRFRAYAE
ncbi:ClpX C4-type zinc finger protein [Nocardioides KLBMP 9356]|uniref:ClpX C4-type zinc finger protein n=1 Tax=Nocardioides potassii TaxID=2911371 RepID=A0ABS9HCF9_9ACTN|nr:ClpX C4-type zinc finger protein [Nocardioides potassii]MCF6378104.1 ClpX C4-type zinc finger protein [Nocardioides potassii]